MRPTTRYLPGILMLLWAAPLPGQLTQSVPLAGSSVAVYNLAGSAHLEAGRGADVIVQVTRAGAGAPRLGLATGPVNGRQALRVRYPDDRIVYRGLGHNSSTQLQVRDDGTFDDGAGGDSDDDSNDHAEDDSRGRGDRRPGRRWVSISGSGGGLEAHADLRLAIPVGKEVALHVAVGDVSVTNVRGRLRIQIGAGPVVVSGAGGELSVETGSGAVRVARFAGQRLDVETGSGGVNGSDLGATELSIETGSGDIVLSGIRAPRLSLATGSGSITSDLGAEAREVSVETGSGDVTLNAPASLGAELEIETGSGGIESDFPVAVTRHARDHMTGQVGDGRGRISVETGSGQVRLVRK